MLSNSSMDIAQWSNGWAGNESRSRHELVPFKGWELRQELFIFKFVHFNYFQMHTAIFIEDFCTIVLGPLTGNKIKLKYQKCNFVLDPYLSSSLSIYNTHRACLIRIIVISGGDQVIIWGIRQLEESDSISPAIDFWKHFIFSPWSLLQSF